MKVKGDRKSLLEKTMTATIYYFSGTGNSLYGARTIAENLGECTIQSIPELMRSGHQIVCPPGIVGIVCPVYSLGVPLIVADFVKNADLSAAEYVFVILTYGAYPGAVEDMIYNIMEAAGRAPDYVTKVKMADNYLPVFNPPTGEKLESLMRSARQGFEVAAHEIHEKQKKVPHSFFIHKLMGRIVYRAMKGDALDKEFHTDPTCNGCGTCEKVCPVNNITIEQERPVWHHHCESCFACIHHCPTKAIQYGSKTRGKGRYRNPEVSLKDLMRKS